MANPKYVAMGKDALTAEIKTRRAAGRKLLVDLRGDEESFRAALENDDVENGEFNPIATTEEPLLAGSGTLPPKPDANAPPAPSVAQEKPTPRKVTPFNLRAQLAAPEALAASQPTQPSEDEWDSDGELYKHKEDKLVYEVVRRDPDLSNKHIKARVPAQESGHPGYYWEGSEKEFEDTFTKQ